MGIAALVEVVAQVFGKLFCRELLCLVEPVLGQLLPMVPPFDGRGEMLQLHGLGLGEVLVALRHVQTIEPGLLGGASAVEEQDVGGDGRIGGEDAGRHTDDRMEVELRQQLLFQVDLGPVRAEQEAVGQDHRRPAALLQTVHDDRHKEVRGLGAGQVVGEMVLDLRFLAAAEGRVHEDHVELVVLGVVQHIPQKGVVVIHPRDVQPMQQQVRDAEHVGELLLFDAVDGIAVGRLVRRALDLLPQLLEPAGDEAAGAASEVRHALADLGPDALGHEVGDGPGRVEFAGGARALELLQDGFVDLAEGVALLVVGEVQLVDDVDDLAKEDAVLHIVVGVGEGGLDDGLLDGRVGVHGQVLQRGEQGVVDEIQQGFTGHALACLVVGPVAPAAAVREDGNIVVLVDLPILLLGVVYLEKQHPGDLLDALGVAVDARVVAHNIPQALDKAG